MEHREKMFAFRRLMSRAAVDERPEQPLLVFGEAAPSAPAAAPAGPAVARAARASAKARSRSAPVKLRVPLDRRNRRCAVAVRQANDQLISNELMAEVCNCEAQTQDSDVSCVLLSQIGVSCYTCL